MASPADGDKIVLTCTTTTPGVTSYEFRYNGSMIVNSASSIYEIAIATYPLDEGSYSCIAYLDGVASEESAPYTLTCESRILGFL